MKQYYKQKYPHINPVGACYFVTFRLYGSIPKSEIMRLKSEYDAQIETYGLIDDIQERNSKIFHARKLYLTKNDQILDAISTGPHFLKEEERRNIVANQLKKYDGELYDLICFSIMSNHVHILIDTQNQDIRDELDINMFSNNTLLSYALKRIKGSSAKYCNDTLQRNGTFWEKENYDIYIRNEKMLHNVIGYILDNPVKAGIVNNWKDYKGNYLKLE